MLYTLVCTSQIVYRRTPSVLWTVLRLVGDGITPGGTVDDHGGHTLYMYVDGMTTGWGGTLISSMEVHSSRAQPCPRCTPTPCRVDRMATMFIQSIYLYGTHVACASR